MTLSRRDFVKTAAAAATALSASRWLRARGANEDLRVAVIGLNGRGRDHIAGFRKLKGVRVVALCDVDRRILEREAKAFESRKETVATVTDARRLFEDPGIDAVAIATPNHWHALLGIWACQAGKDVYVEKPVSHNVWEGRQLVLAAARHGRVVQGGTQSRSSAGMRELMAFLHGGGLGAIRLARGLCYKPRKSIGKVAGDQPIPEGVDYDLWCGPAPKDPLRRQKLHYDWHWVWPTGNGDLGNQGVHQMDLARWALGAGALAPRVLSFGGRLGYEDDGTTPNTQVVVHAYEPAPLVFEVRGLPENSGSGKMDRLRGVEIGVIVEGEHGSAVIPSYEGGTVFDREGKKVREFKGGGDHFQNFVDAVRARKPELLAAPVLDGHLSAALCHLGNVSYQRGRSASSAEMAEALKTDAVAAEALARVEPHLAANGVDPAKTPLRLGAPLRIDPAAETIHGDPEASALLTRPYRAPFTVPSQI